MVTACDSQAHISEVQAERYKRRMAASPIDCLQQNFELENCTIFSFLWNNFFQPRNCRCSRRAGSDEIFLSARVVPFSIQPWCCLRMSREVVCRIRRISGSLGLQVVHNPEQAKLRGCNRKDIQRMNGMGTRHRGEPYHMTCREVEKAQIK